VIARRTRRAVDRIKIAGEQHLGQKSPLRDWVHAFGQRRVVLRGPAFVDVANPPFEPARRHADEIEKMAVPDRSARDPIVHPDPLADKVGRRPDLSVVAHIKVAPSEISQRKHRQRDKAAIAIVDPSQMPGHRRLATVNRRIVDRPTQHLCPRRPIAAGPMEQREIDALGRHIADHQRCEARVIGAGQADRDIGHRTSLSREIAGRAAGLSE
jgi:hypothetical protein